MYIHVMRCNSYTIYNVMMANNQYLKLSGLNLLFYFICINLFILLSLSVPIWMKILLSKCTHVNN